MNWLLFSLGGVTGAIVLMILQNTVFLDRPSNDPLGSSWAAFDPTVNRMAFLSGKESSATLHILDWKSHKTEVVWRDAEKRLIAISHSLQQNEEYSLAISTYRDLIDKYPNSRFLNLAWFRMMQIYLTPPSVDFDKAFEALNRMLESNQLASSIFWSETDLSATDPGEDWIVKYGTNEAYNKFEFNTDLTRDLLGLSVKSSDKRLFLKIDYNSNRDLSGLTFADTVILLDYDTPNEGYRKIGNLSE